MSNDTLRIACAAGFSGDRTDAAEGVVEALLEAGGPSFLVFETLAERTLALAQFARRADANAGYEPLLADMLGPVLGRCLGGGIRIVGNFGAANPPGAARRIAELCRTQGLRRPRIAVVSGDDLSGPAHRAMLRDALDDPLDERALVSANAYIGAGSIADALLAGAEIVVCGRIADPALAVGPALAHFGWRRDDWLRLGRATMAGHLLECGAQVTGGYFADPGYKDVPGLARVGYPIAELDADGGCTIGKPAGSGGRVDVHTVTEQLLYELHDPTAYLTPDVVADIGEATVAEAGPDRVRLEGVHGHPRPPTLKVTVCAEQGWLAEGEISYAGPRAEARARLAGEILRERLGEANPLRIDLIGVASVFDDDAGRRLAARPCGEATDVRLRAALRSADRRLAERLTREVTALYTCGPAGGGGVRAAIRPRLSTRSCLVPREAVPTRFDFLEDGGVLTTDTVTVPLDRVAHARTGDKGDRSNIGVVAWHAELYPLLVAQLDEARVAAVFADRAPSRVVRHLLPRLSAMNFVLDGVLDGGVNDALNLDSHGKALSFLLLDLPLEVPRALLRRLAGPAQSGEG